MGTKLDWRYQDTGEHAGEHHATHNGHRIRAILDDAPLNPFEEHDGNWPIIVDHLRGVRMFAYERADKGTSINYPLERFNEHQIVHFQVHIAKILDTTIGELLDDPALKYSNDAALLRGELDNCLAQVSNSDRLEVYCALYELLGIPCLNGSTSGHSQGDYADVLVVALPEYVTEFGCANVTAEDLEATVQLYGDWCWGNVSGYIVERPEVCAGNPDDEAEKIWEELDACWGFYGLDFDQSGLEEAAMSSIPVLENA